MRRNILTPRCQALPESEDNWLNTSNWHSSGAATPHSLTWSLIGPGGWMGRIFSDCHLIFMWWRMSRHCQTNFKRAAVTRSCRANFTRLDIILYFRDVKCSTFTNYKISFIVNTDWAFFPLSGWRIVRFMCPASLWSLISSLTSGLVSASTSPPSLLSLIFSFSEWRGCEVTVCRCGKWDVITVNNNHITGLHIHNCYH